MIKNLSALTLIGLLLTSQLVGAAKQPYSIVPTSPEEQHRIFDEMAEKTIFSSYLKDDDGNITFVTFNHKFGQGSWDYQVKNDKDTVDGLRDEDIKKLVHFPKLMGVNIQHQTITNDGYAVLGAFPDLEIARITNIHTNGNFDKHDNIPEPTNELFRHLDGARNLKIWDTTHTFGFKDYPPVLHELQGYPELRVMIVDVGHADDFDELFPLIQKSQKIEWLKLHRCPFTEAQYLQILDTLPKLKRLEVKPSGNEPGERWSYQTLRHIKDYPNIEILRLIHQDALPLPWENGLEHLVEAKNLKYLDFPHKPGTKQAVAEEALRKLREARPDLKIRPLLSGEERRQWNEETDISGYDFKWDAGPN